MRKYVLIAAAVLCLAGCSGNANAGGTQAPETTQAATSASVMDEIPNPMKELKSLEELEAALQYPMLTLPEDYHADDFEYYTIADTLGQLECEVGEHDVEIRKQAGSEDITGVYGVEFQDGTYQDITYHYAVSEQDEEPDERDYVAWWENDGYSYAVEVSEITEEQFLTEYLQVLIDRSIAAK